MMRRNEMKWIGRSLALAGALVLAGAGTMAAEYVIGAGETTVPGSGPYKTLNGFRTDPVRAGGFISLADGDTLTFANDDVSLGKQLGFQALIGTPGVLTLRAAAGMSKATLGPGAGHAEDTGGFLAFDSLVDPVNALAALTLDGIELKGWPVTAGTYGRGGAIYARNLDLSTGARGAIFTNNSALGTGNPSTGLGGAVYATNSLAFMDGTFAFTGNTAQGGAGNGSGYGGALYGGDSTTFHAGSYIYSDNKALTGTGLFGGLGGAIYSNELKILGGDHQFIGNHADVEGGAIFGTGWVPVTLIANGGDLLFQGNTQGTGADLRANSVSTGSAPLEFAAKAGQQIKFRDPVMTGANININQTGADNPGTSTTEYAGTVWFDGSYWKAEGSTNPNDFTSEVSGATTVHNGTMKLTGGVTYGLNSISGSYYQCAAATLFVDAAGNQINSHNITFEKGTSLTFDMAGAVAQGEGATTNLIMRYGIGDFGTNLQVDAINVGAANGTFILIDTGVAGSYAYRLADTSTINGQTPPVAVGANARYGLSSFDTGTRTKLLLVTTGADDSRIATWTGAASGVWDLTADNWNLSDGSALNVFKPGDHALFDAAAPADKRTVGLAADTLVSGMAVTDGKYTFQSDAPGTARTLTARAAAATGALIAPTGRLDISGAGTSAHFLVDLDFENGLSVGDGATLSLAAKRTVGAVGGAATGTATLAGGSTLAADATGNVLRANTIALGDGAIFSFDMANAVAQGQAGATVNLTLDATTLTPGATDQYLVHAANVGAANGAFLLLDAGTVNFAGRVAAGSTINGAASPVLAGANARYGLSDFDTATAGKLLLVTTGADDSRRAAWTGADSSRWNQTDDNWTLDGAPALNVFKTGDHALFDDTAPAEARTVVLPGDVTVSGMSVAGGASYTFQSDNPDAYRSVTVRPESASGSAIAPTGALDISGAGTQARFLVGLDVLNGITVDDRATMRLGAKAGVMANGADAVVTLKNGSTLVFEAAHDADTGTVAAGTIVATRITVEAGAKLVGELDINKLFTGDYTGVALRALTALDLREGALLSDDTAFYRYAFALNPDDADEALLSFAPLGDGPEPPASFTGLSAGPNARGLAGALDAAWAAGATLEDGTLKTALNQIVAAPSAEAAKRLNELAPTVLAGGADLAPLAAGRFQQSLDALWRWRQIHDAPDASGLGAASGANSADAWARPAFDADRGWRFWASGSGAWSEYDSPNADPGYDAKEWAATVAGYKTFGPCREWSLGLALNTNHTRLDWDGSSSKTTGDAIAGALLAGFERGGWFVNADAVWGTTEVESRRHLPLAGLTASADYRTHWYGADLTAGRRWQTGGWTLAPAAGARWYRYDTPTVTEKGAGNAGYVMNKHHQTSVELFARLDVSRVWTLANGVSLRPHGFAGVAVETADRSASPTMGFVGTPAIPAFRGRSPEAGRTAAQFGLGLETKFAERWTVDLEYAGEFRDRAQRHGGRVGIGLAF